MYPVLLSLLKNSVVRILIVVLIQVFELHFSLIVRKRSSFLLNFSTKVLKKLKIRIGLIVYSKNLLKFKMSYLKGKRIF